MKSYHAANSVSTILGNLCDGQSRKFFCYFCHTNLIGQLKLILVVSS